MKFMEAAKKVEDNVLETQTYLLLPLEHWMKVQNGIAIERLNEVRELLKGAKKDKLNRIYGAVSKRKLRDSPVYPDLI